ncbi:MAG: site-specific integrase, partial [Verrucomicrobiaceae bacterium]
LNEATSAIVRGELRKPSRDTVEGFFRGWIADDVEPRCVPRATALYVSTLEKHVYPELGTKRLAAITASDVQKLLNAVARKEKPGKPGETYSRRTVEIVKDTLHAGFAFAMHPARLIPFNPAAGVSLPKYARRPDPRRALRTDDARKLLQEAAGREVYGPIVVFMVGTGARVSEALAIRWRDINLTEGLVWIGGVLDRPKGGGAVYRPGTKTGEGRLVPLPAFLLVLFKDLDAKRLLGEHPEHKEGFIFLNGAGSPMDVRCVNRELAKMSEAAGIGHVSAHVLRHTFATVGMTAMKDPQAVSKMLGHSRPDLTMNLYGHVLEDRTNAIARSLNDALG